MEDKSIAIIGAGFAGLSAGIYAQMNGYQSQIYEMGDLPGGLCTAWKRKGYTIDGCIHWLVGSSPNSGMYRFWQEVGVAQGRQFVNAEQFVRAEGPDGRVFTVYCDVDKLEKHMLELSPQDADLTRQFIQGVRLGITFDQAQPTTSDSVLQRTLKGLKFGLLMASKGKMMQDLMRTTTLDFTNRFKDPLIRRTLQEMWLPEFSIFFVLFTLAYLNNQNAGYPIGGSLPMSLAMEKRYKSLGGQVHYRSKVEKIVVENDRAVGIRLVDGSEVRAGRVISAADGHTTIFKMLDGKYADEKVREPYEKWPIFPPLLFVGLGVNRRFDDVPQTVSGMSYMLRQPTEIADAVRDSMPVHIFNQDPTLAPEGKTSVVVMLPSKYDYWKALAEDKASYEEKKDQVARTIVTLLEQRFPGIGEQVEMVDVATPLTFERYTGNWQGTFEGWLITPQNAHMVMKPMSQTLPGLENFYQCGQWVEPGGGLPTGVMSGRRLVQALCKADGAKFTTSVG
ncbi:MAG TPA: NAD(P)/FAD-dependent oxidoreductase [Anaerolineales bacterium]|nr:NAD(P)/FAD-dependent oxidoreductase [Anaerolineales bacterium]